MTQNEQILNYLRTNKGITSKEAFDLFGITRLSGRIYDLRNQGYNIQNSMRHSKNRYGVMTNYVEYSLVKKEEQNVTSVCNG